MGPRLTIEQVAEVYERQLFAPGYRPPSWETASEDQQSACMLIADLLAWSWDNSGGVPRAVDLAAAAMDAAHQLGVWRRAWTGFGLLDSEGSSDEQQWVAMAEALIEAFGSLPHPVETIQPAGDVL